VVVVGLTVAEPPVALLALKPEPEQEVAFVELQVRVEDWPAVIEVGLADRLAPAVTVTVSVAEAEADPPEPVQVTA